MSILLLRGKKKRSTPSGGGGGDTPFTFTTSFEGMTAGQSPSPLLADAGPTDWAWADQSPEVSSTRAFSGTQSLRHRYNGDPTPQESSSEQKFVVGRSIGEFWFSFQWWVPSNYTHRDVGGAGATAKLVQIWKGDYNADSMRWGVSLNRTSGGGSIIYPTATRGNETGVTQAPVQNFPSIYGTDFISPTGIIEQGVGAWHLLKFHFKPASARDATDGVWKMWVGNTVFMDGGGTLWPPLAAVDQSEDVTIDNGYLMGSHNSGFAETTDFFIDDIEFTNVDPGWE